MSTSIAAHEEAAIVSHETRVEQQAKSLDEGQLAAQRLAALAEKLRSAKANASSLEQISASAEQLSAAIQELSSAATEVMAVWMFSCWRRAISSISPGTISSWCCYWV